MSSTLYIISGLGADERVFKNLVLPGVTIHHLPWIKPIHNESIKEYAGRMAAEISEKDPVILGLSFGGMMAQEIADLIAVKQVILLSTVKTRKEIPKFYLWFIQYILQYIPGKWLKLGGFFLPWYFGIRNSTDSMLIKQIVKDSDPDFLHWALQRIAVWDRAEKSPSPVHLHGSTDLVFPIRKIQNCVRINGGGHLMVMTKSEKISELLMNILQKK